MLNVSRPPSSSELSHYVNVIWTYSSEPQHGYEKIVPSVHAQLLINLDGDTLSHRDLNGLLKRKTGPMGLQGLLTEPVLIEKNQKTDICGVQFTAMGLSVFVDQPACAYVNQIVDAVSVWGLSADSLRTSLTTTDDPALRCDFIEAFLVRQLRQPGADVDMLRVCVDSLLAGMNVTELQKTVGLSQRKLHDLFDRCIGIKPKLFSRIARFSRTLPAVSDHENLTQIAIENGYADHAHMTREFHWFTGRSPRAESLIIGEPQHAYVNPDEIFKNSATEEATLKKNKPDLQ
ncbi:MAG: helix-turn-helix domain-containing protein [Gammaproteobacteria bacterium]|nr:helix-turn-helix domain-containing protein [Gammaproteobacteria bacterium]